MRHGNIDGPTREDEGQDREEYERVHNMSRAERELEIFGGRSPFFFGNVFVVLASLAAIILAGWLLLSGVRWLWEHPLW